MLTESDSKVSIVNNRIGLNMQNAVICKYIVYIVFRNTL